MHVMISLVVTLGFNGAKLKALRLERGHSQRELSARTAALGRYISARTVRDLERGTIEDPHFSVVQVLAEALAVDLEELAA